MRDISLNLLDIVLNSLDANAKNIDIDIESKKDKVSFTVSDDGCGIENELLSKILEKGFTTKDSKGDGLPLVKSLASEFEINSIKGKGTTVKASFNKDTISFGNLGEALIVAIADGRSDIKLLYKGQDIEFSLDTKIIKEDLEDGIKITDPQILNFLKHLINDNIDK